MRPQQGQNYEDLFKTLFQSIYPFKECPASISLRKAAELGCENAIKRIYENNIDIDVNEPDEKQRTALHEAAMGAHRACIEVLLERGADADRTYHGIKPFCLADHDAACLRLLLSATKQIPCKAFFNAAIRGELDYMELLLAHGFSINDTDNKGYTVVHHLIDLYDFEKRAKILDWLLERGVDINKADLKGATPLHLACGLNHARWVDYLLSKGAHILPKDSYGDTPIAWTLLGLCPEETFREQVTEFIFMQSLKIAPYGLRMYFAYHRLKDDLQALRIKTVAKLTL